MTDVDQELIDASRAVLKLMGEWGMDIYPEYSRFLAAVGAAERARAEESTNTKGATW